MVHNYLDTTLTDAQKEAMHWNHEVTQGMVKALENAMIHNDNGIGLPYWAKRNPAVVSDVTFVLSKLGIAFTRVTKNFSRMEFNTALINSEEFKKWRFNSRLKAMVMRRDTKEYPTNLVKVNNKETETGIDRKGFAKIAKNEFMLDTDTLTKYRRPIVQNLIKSIKIGIEQGKIKDKFFEDKANYRLVVNKAVEYYMANPKQRYNLEKNVSDQRGRSIYKALKRVGNPTSSKDFRALIVVPKESAITIKLGSERAKDQLDDILYFIAELTRSKATTPQKKILAGNKAYRTRHLPQLNLKSEEDRKDLHELVWLERIYDKLDEIYKGEEVLWDIPLEADASMSIAQIVGALTNDQRLLESTNVIGDTLTDPWYIEGVRRNAGKAVGTPVFYGSSQSAMGLISSKKQLFEQILMAEDPTASEAEYIKAKAQSKKEIQLIRKEFNTGRFAVMKQFKDLFIQNYSVEKPVIPVKLYKDTFNVHVNKFTTAGSELIVTEAYDTKSGKFKRSFTHEPVLIPDYKRMKLFWATCAIHGLDSQIMDKIAYTYTYWMLTIHDAIICLPGHAKILRQAYADELKEINTHRYSIIRDFRESIGATSTKADVDYYKLSKIIVQAPENTPYLATAMK